MLHCRFLLWRQLLLSLVDLEEFPLTRPEASQTNTPVWLFRPRERCLAGVAPSHFDGPFAETNLADATFFARSQRLEERKKLNMLAAAAADDARDRTDAGKRFERQPALDDRFLLPFDNAARQTVARLRDESQVSAVCDLGFVDPFLRLAQQPGRVEVPKRFKQVLAIVERRKLVADDEQPVRFVEEDLARVPSADPAGESVLIDSPGEVEFVGGLKIRIERTLRHIRFGMLFSLLPAAIDKHHIMGLRT